MRTKCLSVCAIAISLAACAVPVNILPRKPKATIVLTNAKPKPESIQKTPEKPRPSVPQQKQIKKACDAACQEKWNRFGDFKAAVSKDDLRNAKRMIRQGTVTLEGVFGMEALRYAQSERMLRFLIQNGADVNSTNSDGETALMLIAFEGTYWKAEYLIKNRANVRIKNTKANTSAISYCTNKRIARLLIKMGADVNEINIYGITPLIYASNRGRNDVAQVLIDNDANVNVNSPVVGTALMLASRVGNLELVELLLSKDAKVNVKGTDYFDRQKRKKTALQLAIESGEDEIVEILREHGAVE